MVVIEAVFEELGLKRQVLAEVDVATSVHDCIFASNTSSLPIGDDRRGQQAYSDRVHRHALLQSGREDAAARGRACQAAPRPRSWPSAVALGKRQGKTVMVVNDGTGFYTTRVLAPYLNEAAFLLTEGVAIDQIDPRTGRSGAGPWGRSS